MNNNIDIRSITQLLGLNFYIPDYQRGYRWTTLNVKQLLDDIWEYRQEKTNANTFYCLQPIVVRKKQWTDSAGKIINGYELIDGQQRLTTLHRLISYVSRSVGIESIKEEYGKVLYTLDYKTRPETKAFLQTTDFNDSKPDLYYLSNAYKTIDEWFANEERAIGRQGKNQFLDTLLPTVDTEGSFPEWSVQIIWYEINDQNQSSEELFIRLNRGKIPLTSAELIKAKFVNELSFREFTNEQKIKRRTQLIQLWDEMENQLNNPKFWGFISNVPIESYSCKIEYLFDIATQKNSSRDSLYSFIHFFDSEENAESLWKKWVGIEEIFRSLVYWFTDKNLYHKIGFLIATGTKVTDLIKLKKKYPKSIFETKLNELIGNIIPEDWRELNYNNRNEIQDILNVLLFVNIELTRLNSNDNDFFPFHLYKKLGKSLEHIHAQNIEGINENKSEEWLGWLDAHTSILESVATDKNQAQRLIQEVENIRRSIRYVDFQDLSSKILKLIPNDSENENEYLHQINNLAILAIEDNIVLSNSVFEVKRTKVIELDRKGSFIPLATKRVFLNYYVGEGYKQSCVWTKTERENYLKEMEHCINPYLVKQKIIENEA